MAMRIQLRRGSADEWTAANPVLAEGESGLETDTGNVKYGDGVRPWAELPYSVAVPGPGEVIVGSEDGPVAVDADTIGGDVDPELVSQRVTEELEGRPILDHDTAGGAWYQLLRRGVGGWEWIDPPGIVAPLALAPLDGTLGAADRTGPVTLTATGVTWIEVGA